MKTVRISNLHDDDVKDVLALIEDYPDIFSSQEYDLYRQVVLSHMLELPGYEHGSHKILVAKISKEIVGCAIFEKVEQSQDYYMLDYLVVKKQHQNFGVGKLILSQVVTKIKDDKGKHIILETSNEKHNEKVKKFYEKVGFKKVGELPDFYPPAKRVHIHTQDCILYLKTL